jgi:hypothetical protein
MKLFFDHNLSYKLVGRLADLFPDECTGNEFRPKAARDEGLWVQGILRPW